MGLLVTCHSVVYRLRYEEGFEWLLPVEQSDFERLRFDATSRVSTWTPIEMKRVKISEGGKVLAPADAPACSGGDMMLLAERAREVLSPVAADCVEFLPLQCSGTRFFAVNVVRRVGDLLDTTRSKAIRAPDNGEILLIQKHVFRSTERALPPIFKLEETPRGLIYVTQPVVDAAMAGGVAGIGFVRV